MGRTRSRAALPGPAPVSGLSSGVKRKSRANRSIGNDPSTWKPNLGAFTARCVCVFQAGGRGGDPGCCRSCRCGGGVTQPSSVLPPPPPPAGSSFLRVPQAFCQRAGLQAAGAAAGKLQRPHPSDVSGRERLLDRTHLFLRGRLP